MHPQLTSFQHSLQIIIGQVLLIILCRLVFFFFYKVEDKEFFMLSKINILFFLLVISFLSIHTSSVAVESEKSTYSDQLTSENKVYNKQYSGNSSTKVYHNKECRYFDCTACTIGFDSKEEAEKAGYTPCRLCENKKPSQLSQETEKNHQESLDNTKKEQNSQ
ncbi:hypothetical protein K9U34_06095 [Lawsonia intracellularis]|uniref:NA n=1 Tax=Lawsonia intracellularis (strain PHE/MN1-00) TaxID=363253 RepID=Q1MSE1_LAWIP|nr:hypothetical protein [Lawsonia intracellularis]AGC49428.1 hypothetical protein LAW_00027 [Lawsonia intracellularis N343]KAA0204943.1 hypothetical protein C4K43_00320 [Lawsonia intracellularis]MBZ3893164.1 hypothetical protein [Lawsonia intracellularis]RBN32508.1 hypothetical protein DR194_06055 [Lawsonia intracellularis]RBN34073.1 hypothetical protein DR192_06065 [Lawsonia intracellularis]